MAARAARFYGDPPPWPQHPYRFAYPLYFAFFVAPLLPLPFPWAAATWMALLIVASGVATLLLCHLMGWPTTARGRLLAVLGGVPLLWMPRWPLDFVASLRGYTGDEPTPSALLLLAHLLLDRRLDATWSGPAAALAIVAGAVLVAYAVGHVWGLDGRLA